MLAPIYQSTRLCIIEYGHRQDIRDYQRRWSLKHFEGIHRSEENEHGIINPFLTKKYGRPRMRRTEESFDEGSGNRLSANVAVQD
jgi:hypothetical protein